MNRYDLQELSRIRIVEAKVLLENTLYDGAYYLCGYSIECALKACIAKNINQYDFPDKRLIIDSYTHDVVALIKLAGIYTVLQDDMKTNQNLVRNWTIIKEWSEAARYERNTPEVDARDLYNAITDPVDGVMQWILIRW